MKPPTPSTNNMLRNTPADARSLQRYSTEFSTLRGALRRVPRSTSGRQNSADNGGQKLNPNASSVRMNRDSGSVAALSAAKPSAVAKRAIHCA
ncbi:hypothetical protein [Glutamicibacter sp. NPDC087344]|uniref:hypothetical protein n=1 Tax=Glutamicibacter sp. NPDC087344 TaxID=3363994 RepID=UPI00382BE324